ncbi:class I SAM-dependent methyltransferase [Desulfopila inferna]|uniref:class I SAM-dependent methyltransferase n=1 Tax=Desulfopila inferna TaxID=468528 RepID=UPI00196610A0|nr:class I SAM-dependent methyltransferase [Desulfopila inferna]MBM9606496.1 class I SAM-dependent methyltransferase [Desulfopila inferna]
MNDQAARAESALSRNQTEDKWNLETILDPRKIRKGHTRWNQFHAALLQMNCKDLAGPILDFGFGIGYFVLEGLRRQKNIWGVDLLPGKIERYQRLIDYTESPEEWKKRCVIADGEELPFHSESFSAISSWYVFEHIPFPSLVLRELVRITRKDGVIAIRAQDARNGWEGHCKIPWVPFLSGRMAEAWIEEFGKSPALRRGVYDITQPQVISILEELGCTIVKQAPSPLLLIKDHWKLSSEKEVRSRARQVRQEFEKGEWQPQPENLYIYACKR